MDDISGAGWPRAGLSRRAALGMATALMTPHAVLAAPVVDARGRRVGAADASRVVCIGGAITEIAYALGAEGHVVAVDSTSQFPPQALKDKRNIGYMRSVSPEGVLALRPSLILAMNDAGPPPALDVLAASGTPLVFVDATLTPRAVEDRIRFLAVIFNVAAAGERLCKALDGQFADLATWLMAHPARKRVLFVLSMRNDHPVVGGTGTSADAIITLAGGVNAAAVAGYKPVSDEALGAMAPDVVLAMDHAGPSLDASALSQPGFQLTPAGRRHALIRMDGEFLLGLGPRTPQAALELAKRLAQV
jgi:iron complex transport system substrate-binding protein